MNLMGPIKAAERLDALDVLRGFALCGILLMNIPAMGGSWLSGIPLGSPSFADPSWVTWLAQKMFFEGSMRGLFTLLFGAGILFMTRRAAEPDGPVEVADVFYRRCLGLIALGLINVIVLLWPGDILFIYGISGLFLFVARRARARTLLALSAAVIIASSVAYTGMKWKGADTLRQAERVDAVLAVPNHPALTDTQQAALTARAELLKKVVPTDKELAEETAQRRAIGPAVLGWSIASWSDWALGTDGWIAAIAESIGFMLLGMALFKSRVLMGDRPLRFYLWTAILSLGIALPLRGVVAWLVWTGHVSHPTFASAVYRAFAYEFMRLPLTVFWMSLLIAVWKVLPTAVFAPLRALGKMALTNYLGQSLITSVLFYGFHLYGRLNWAQMWVIAALIWAGEALFSMAWLRHYTMGPAEWLLRSVTYGHRHALRKRRLDPRSELVGQEG